MDEVSPGLFVGTLENAGDSDLLAECTVSSVVSLTFSPPENGFPERVSVFSEPMVDGPQNTRQSFESAVRQTVTLLEDGERVLVHCSRGASRSPTVAAVALALYREIGIDDAFEQVETRRTGYNPHEEMVRQAVAVYQTVPG